MTIQTATDRRAAAAARQRLSRARRAFTATPRQPIECGCCGRLWVPVRQGRYCSRPCVERAGHLRRLLQSDSGQQRRRLAGWLAAARDTAERQRLLEAHRHLLEPLVESELIEVGWLYGPQPGSVRHSAMAQVDPARAEGLV